MSLKEKALIDETPIKSNFYFGFHICASCLDFRPIPPRQRVSRFIWPEQYGCDNEIMIPSGRQAFHRQCLKELEEACETVAKENK